MLFHQRYVLITILCLFMSVTIIIAVGGGKRNLGAGPSGYQSPEYYSAAESSDNYSTSYEDSNRETTSDYIGVTNCWHDMQYYCEMKNPDVMDFVKLAIANWSTGFFEPNRNMTEYYNSFSQFLNAEGILPPDQYCQQFVPEPIKPLQLKEIEDDDDNNDNTEIPENKTARTRCQKALSRFGITRDQALDHGFYHTKIDEFDRNNINNETLFNVAALYDEYYDFKGVYMRYMINNVQLYEGFDTPLEFCQKIDETELLRRKMMWRGRNN